MRGQEDSGTPDVTRASRPPRGMIDAHDKRLFETRKFEASQKWFFNYRRRWGLSFQEKTNVKRKSVAARLPYVRKHHQYILYSAFKEFP